MKTIIKKNLVILSIFTFATVALAPPYTIGWYSVDGGGVINDTGGTYSVSGTIGQPDAGPALNGGTFVDNGGFWGFFATVVPRLKIVRSGSNVILSWPSPSVGYRLRQSPNLFPGSWSDVGPQPADDGFTKSLTLPIGPSLVFYRLST